MQFEPIDLIKEVYRQTKLLRMHPPYVTRLVKLLYLADVEWRRAHGGEPIANLTWKFLHFGPYANELADLLGGPDVEVKELEHGKEVRSFNFPDDDGETTLPSEVVSLVRQLVSNWGDVPLNKLLDHVYFDTEPMENAKRYELLDFSVLIALPAVKKPLFNQAKIAELRKAVTSRVKDLHLTRNGIHIPSIEVSGEGFWDDEADPLPLPSDILVRHSAE